MLIFFIGTHCFHYGEWLALGNMSENRFKVSKTDVDGSKEPKETYRRVDLSTDIEVNIIEPCM